MARLLPDLLLLLLMLRVACCWHPQACPVHCLQSQQPACSIHVQVLESGFIPDHATCTQE